MHVTATEPQLRNADNMERLRLVGQGQSTQWPPLKKMYLILVLSTVCIFFFQYHISRAQLDVDDAAPDSPPVVLGVHHQEPMRELLLADSSAAQQSTTDDNVITESEVVYYICTPIKQFLISTTLPPERHQQSFTG